MGRRCKLSKTAISNFIYSMSGQLVEIFDRAVMQLQDSTRYVKQTGENFIFWAEKSVDETEAVVNKAIEVGKRKLSAAKARRESTPATIKKEEVHIEKTKLSNGQIEEKKIVKVREVPNPERPMIERLCAELERDLRRLYELSNECTEYRRTVWSYEENLQGYLDEALSTEKFLTECRESAERHSEILGMQAEHALSALSRAMNETVMLPQMKENDGYVDMDGVDYYCTQLGDRLDAVEERLYRLKKTSEGLNGRWADSVYDHFNNTLQCDISHRLSNSVSDLVRIKKDLEEMCAALEEYYCSPAGVDLKSRQFSYTYFGLEKGIEGTVSEYCSV